MVELRDHAERGEGPTIVLTADLPNRPASAIVSSALSSHDELTDEGDFPEHGVFLEVETPSGEIEYWETTSTLARMVMGWADEKGVEPEGCVLKIDQVSKTPGGEWRFFGQLENGQQP